MKSNFKKKTIKTLFAYNVFFVIVVMIIYCVITRLLSYPPNSINTEFEKNIDMGFNFNVQYAATVLLGMTLSNSIFLLELKKIKDWEKYIGYKENDPKTLERIDKIKKEWCEKNNIKLIYYSHEEKYCNINTLEQLKIELGK